MTALAYLLLRVRRALAREPSSDSTVRHPELQRRRQLDDLVAREERAAIFRDRQP